MTSALRLALSLLFGGVMSWLRSAQAFFRGKREGEAQAERRAAERTLVLVAEAKEIRNEVEALPPDELRKRATRWVRGSKPPKKTTD